MYSTSVARNMAGVLSDSRLVGGGRMTCWKITVCVVVTDEEEDEDEEATMERGVRF